MPQLLACILAERRRGQRSEGRSPPTYTACSAGSASRAEHRTTSDTRSSTSMYGGPHATRAIADRRACRFAPTDNRAARTSASASHSFCHESRVCRYGLAVLVLSHDFTRAPSAAVAQINPPWRTLGVIAFALSAALLVRTPCAPRGLHAARQLSRCMLRSGCHIVCCAPAVTLWLRSSCHVVCCAPAVTLYVAIPLSYCVLCASCHVVCCDPAVMLCVVRQLSRCMLRSSCHVVCCAPGAVAGMAPAHATLAADARARR